MKSTKQPTKGRSTRRYKDHGPCRARTCDRRIMRKVVWPESPDDRTMGRRSSAAPTHLRRTAEANPKRGVEPTTRSTTAARRRLIDDITERSLRR